MKLRPAALIAALGDRHRQARYPRLLLEAIAFKSRCSISSAPRLKCASRVARCKTKCQQTDQQAEEQK
jgi:hypothetical protein